VKTKKEPTRCDVCLSNLAVVKGYWMMLEGTDNEQTQKLPSCGVCLNLNSKSVEKLLGLPKPKRLRLIKRWWTPARHDARYGVSHGRLAGGAGMNRLKRLIGAAGPIFYWAWIGIFFASLASGVLAMLRGDLPLASVIFYAGTGGFLTGTLVAYLPLRWVHRHDFKKANEELTRAFARVRRRIEPLILKSRAEMSRFMERLSEGQYEAAQAHRDQMERLQSYMDAVMEEEFDSDVKEKGDA
jgi:hypothetical protein